MPGYVAIGVKDLSASRRFWCEALGLAVTGEWPRQVSVGGDGFEILLDATGDTPVAPGIEIALRVPAAAIDAAVARIRPFRGPKDFGGPNGLEAGFRDPDGYVAILYAGRERH